jgi:L,D-transpeptidase ErfK/SrfK
MMRNTLLASALCLIATTASAAEYWLPDRDDLFGAVQVIKARYEDTFVGLARTYNVGFESLRRANPGVDAWLPGEGTEIVIPTEFVMPHAPRDGIVVNVAELRLYYFPAEKGTAPEGADPAGRRVITYPISIGRMDWSTPIGTTRVMSKVANPSWHPPQSIREEHAANNDPLPKVVPPGPDNPLGKHALRLGLPGYLIHGTNKPSGVGMRVTHGCIRMFPEDIEAMYRAVPAGTLVHIVNQPFKLGWGPKGLYLEAHPPLQKNSEEDGDEEIAARVVADEQDLTLTDSVMTDLTRLYVAATAQRRADVDWKTAEQVMEAARGVPAFVATAADQAESLAAEGTSTR